MPLTDMTGSHEANDSFWIPLLLHGTAGSDVPSTLTKILRHSEEGSRLSHKYSMISLF